MQYFAAEVVTSTTSAEVLRCWSAVEIHISRRWRKHTSIGVEVYKFICNFFYHLQHFTSVHITVNVKRAQLRCRRGFYTLNKSLFGVLELCSSVLSGYRRLFPKILPEAIGQYLVIRSFSSWFIYLRHFFINTDLNRACFHRFCLKGLSTEW